MKSGSSSGLRTRKGSRLSDIEEELLPQTPTEIDSSSDIYEDEATRFYAPAEFVSPESTTQAPPKGWRRWINRDKLKSWYKQQLKATKKNPGRLLYWAAGLTVTVVLLVLLFGSSEIRRPSSVTTTGDGQESMDQALVDGGHGHLKDHVEQLQRLDSGWTEDTYRGITAKRFFSGRSYSEDSTMNSGCKMIFPPEFNSGLLEVHGQKPSRGYDHVVISIDAVLRVQETLLEQLAEELTLKEPDAPPEAIMISPKAWNASGLVHSSFNPCLLSIRSETGMILHLANPSISNDVLHSLDPGKVAMGRQNVEFQWSSIDIFQSPGILPMNSSMFVHLHSHFNEPVGGQQAYKVFAPPVSYSVQMWIHLVYHTDQWKAMMFGESSNQNVQ